MSSSSRISSAVIAGALSLGVLGAVRRAPSPPPPVRPSVTLVVEIPSRTYRGYMGDPDCTTTCATLLQRLRPEIRKALAAEFPFIDWTPGAAPTTQDTIVVSWQNDPTTSQTDTRLEFRLEGPRASDRTVAFTQFEVADTLNERPDADWKPERLDAIWLKQLPAKLKGAELVPQVFGRVPIGATTEFSPTSARVRAHPDSINAEPTRHPTFEVSVRVNHDRIDDDGVMRLTQCSFGTGRSFYSCPVSVIQIQDRQLRDAELRNALAAPNGVKATATRLLSFKAKTGPGVALTGPDQ